MVGRAIHPRLYRDRSRSWFGVGLATLRAHGAYDAGVAATSAGSEDAFQIITIRFGTAII